MKEIVKSKSFAWGLFLLWALCFFANSLRYDLVAFDFEHYYYVPHNLTYSDWHSPLLTFKLYLLHHLLCPEQYNIYFISFLLKCVYLTIFIIACGLLFSALLKQKIQGWIFLFFLSFTSIFSYAILTNFSRDTASFIQIVLLFAIYYVSLTKEKKSWPIAIAYFLFIFDTITFRSNTILLLPILSYFNIELVPNLRFKHIYSKYILCTILSAIFCAGLYTLNYQIFQSQKSYPQSAMQVSDIYNVCILNNDFSLVDKLYGQGERHIPPYPANGKDMQKTIFQVYSIRSKSRTPQKITIQKEWYQQACEYPSAFLLSRIVCLSQLYFNMYTPTFLDDWVKRFNEKADAHIPFSQLPNLEGVSFIKKFNTYRHFTEPYIIRGLAFILFIWDIIGAYILYIRTRKKSNHNLLISRASFALGAVSFLSYVPFTPTPDARFMVPVYFFLTMSLLFYIADYVSRSKIFTSKYPR